jgi:hypothetical protein
VSRRGGVITNVVIATSIISVVIIVTSVAIVGACVGVIILSSFAQ